MAKELKIGTAEEREALAEQALTDEDIVDALAQEIAGSSRIRRQKAASTVALIADKDASVLLPFADDIASGLTKPEAQTRWEVLHALDQMGKAGQRYDEDVLVAAEDSLYDETNGFVREAAFHFFCGYGSASTDNSEEVWTQIDEAIQCYHGNPEFTDMLTQLVAFAEGNISLATSSALAQRICQRRVQNRLHIAALRKLYHAACHAESMRLARIPVYADAFNHCISLLSYTVYSTLHKHTSHFAFFNLLFAYQ